MLALQSLDNFNNITSPFNASVTMQRTLLSPQGNYLLRYDPTSVRLYDINQRIEIPLNVTTTFLKAQWTIDQSCIIFTNIQGIFSLSLNDSSVSAVIAQNAANYITDFQLTPNSTILFYLNRSQLNAINYYTRAPLFLTSNSNKCNATVMKYDPLSNTIITSSLASGQSTCFICKWTLNNNTFSNPQFTNLSICVINDIYIFGNFIALTKKKFNFNFMNTIILDLNTLSQITKTSQARSNSNPAFIVPFHNYYIQYFSLSNFIYVYRENFTSVPHVLEYPFVRSIQYDPFRECLYVFAKHRVMMVNTIETMAMAYNCSQVKGGVNGSKGNYSRECECPNGTMFNKETFACQNISCEGLNGTCMCSYGKAFNSYNLKCQLSCLAIDNAVPTQPFDVPQQCQCQSPFVWNAGNNDCSAINCSLITYSASTQLSQSCNCTTGYSWDSQLRICKTSIDYFPNPVVIDLKNNTNNKTIIASSSESSSSPAGIIVGIIVAVLLILAALFYYYKKCKNSASRESQPQQEEPRATDRQLTEMGKATTPTFQSNEHLQSQPQKSHHSTDQPDHQQPQDQLQNFSIEDQNQQKANYFSEIQSNIDEPLA